MVFWVCVGGRVAYVYAVEFAPMWNLHPLQAALGFSPDLRGARGSNVLGTGLREGNDHSTHCLLPHYWVRERSGFLGRLSAALKGHPTPPKRADQPFRAHSWKSDHCLKHCYQRYHGWDQKLALIGQNTHWLPRTKNAILKKKLKEVTLAEVLLFHTGWVELPACSAYPFYFRQDWEEQEEGGRARAGSREEWVLDHWAPPHPTPPCPADCFSKQLDGQGAGGSSGKNSSCECTREAFYYYFEGFIMSQKLRITQFRWQIHSGQSLYPH